MATSLQTRTSKARRFVPANPRSTLRLPATARSLVSRETPKVARPAKAKPAPHEYPTYDTSVAPAFAASPSIKPSELYKVLEVAPYVRIDFSGERQLQSFRQNLYAVNIQGKFRYATRREGWSSLIILRLK